MAMKQTGRLLGKRRWYVNCQGQTMVLVDRPGAFLVGEGDGQHQRLIDRSYLMAAKEVTVDQFREFRKSHKVLAPSGDCPVDTVSWYDAAESGARGQFSEELNFPSVLDKMVRGHPPAEPASQLAWPDLFRPSSGD
jgi:formylglycine-generating enzyme required for sulfatase activity